MYFVANQGFVLQNIKCRIVTPVLPVLRDCRMHPLDTLSFQISSLEVYWLLCKKYLWTGLASTAHNNVYQQSCQEQHHLSPHSDSVALLRFWDIAGFKFYFACALVQVINPCEPRICFLWYSTQFMTKIAEDNTKIIKVIGEKNGVGIFLI